MLNGIGGRTIAEAKERMSHKESLQWASYIRQRGSLNMAMRLEKQLEHSVALLCTVVNNSAGGKAKMSDYLPGSSKPDDVVADVSQVAVLLKSVAKPGKPGAKKMKYTRQKSAPK